jgi:hypothetical protein
VLARSVTRWQAEPASSKQGSSKAVLYFIVEKQKK